MNANHKAFDYEVQNTHGSTNVYWVELTRYADGWAITVDGSTRYFDQIFPLSSKAREFAIGWCKQQAAGGDEIVAAKLKGWVR